MTQVADGINLLHGDSTELMATVDPESVDLILTSPPYDEMRQYGSTKGAFDFDVLAPLLVRALKPGGCLVWVVGDQVVDGTETGTSFRQALGFMAHGLKLNDTMIYRKANPMPLTSAVRYQQEFEYMFCFSRGAPKTLNKMMEDCKQAGRLNPCRGQRKDNGVKEFTGAIKPYSDTKPRGNIWEYSVAQVLDNGGHPAPYPLQLALDHVLSWTNPGDLVLDPFTGSGTTGVACIETGRRFLGMEINPIKPGDPDYFTTAVYRMGKALQAKEAAEREESSGLFAGLEVGA